jgi:hypothetical protein
MGRDPNNAQLGHHRLRELDSWLQPIGIAHWLFGANVSTVFFACWRSLCQLILKAQAMEKLADCRPSGALSCFEVET